MYASQTKRLCVREASSDDSRVNPASKSHTQQDNMTGNTYSNGNTNQSFKDGTPNDWIIISSYRTDLIEAIDEVEAEKSDHQNLEILLDVTNQITGSNDKKLSLITHPKFVKFIDLMKCEQSSLTLKSHLAYIFCSIAKSNEIAVLKLIDLSVHELIFSGLDSDDQTLVEACLRCLRAIVEWPMTHGIFYNQTEDNDSTLNNPSRNVKLIDKILSFASPNQSIQAQECVSDIMTLTCKGELEQKQLYDSNALQIIRNLFDSLSPRVIISAINWLTHLCYNNLEISQIVYNSSCNFMDELKRFMLDNHPEQLQFVSARCYTIIYKALPSQHDNSDPALVSHVLACLVRMVKADKHTILRTKATGCIAYLIEGNRKLQTTASICDRLIESLIKMLNYETDIMMNQRGQNYNNNSYQNNDEPDRTQFTYRLNMTNAPSYMGTNHVNVNDPNEKPDTNQEMKQAAFYALAALGSTDEIIRKKIFNNSPVIPHLVKNLSETNEKTLRAALTCLLSLSRSVQQLRTTVVDANIYSALKHLLQKTTGDLLVLVLANIINVSVEFSPGKQHFLDQNTIKTLCELTRSPDSSIRLHGMWILMNIVYQEKNSSLKLTIIKTLGMSVLAELLEKETNGDILMKTLGFLRNVLTPKTDIDTTMSIYGDQIIKSLIYIIESRDISRELQDQTLCVLANIADGSQKSKDFLMNSKILNYLSKVIGDDEAGSSRMTAILCITNLSYAKTDGCSNRQNELRKYKIDEKIMALLETSDPELSDKVRTAHHQFASVDRKKSNAD